MLRAKSQTLKEAPRKDRTDDQSAGFVLRVFFLGSFANVRDILWTCKGQKIQVYLIPIGVSFEEVKEFIIVEEEYLKEMRIAEPMEWHPKEFGQAVFFNYDYVWNIEGKEHLYEIYKNLCNLFLEGTNPC